MWEREIIDVGEIKVGESIDINFRLQQPLPQGFKILKMRSSCGCAKPIKTISGVKVTYKGKKVPAQLIHKGQYTTTKRVSVETTTGKYELKFTVIVKQL